MGGLGDALPVEETPATPSRTGYPNRRGVMASTYPQRAEACLSACCESTHVSSPADVVASVSDQRIELQDLTAVGSRRSLRVDAEPRAAMIARVFARVVQVDHA